MDDSEHAVRPAVVTRRRLLQALAAAGVTAPLALDLLAQSGGRLSVEAIRQASAVLGEEFSAERLAIIEKALARNLDQFQIVRDLVIDDTVEPAPIFMAKTHAGPAPGSTTGSGRPE